METLPANKRQKYLYVAAALLAVSLFLAYKASTRPAADNQNITATESSADVAATPPSSAPKDSNINRLKDVGMLVKQIDALQYALYQYSQKADVPITNMVIDPATIKHIVPNTDTEPYDHLYTFSVSFGGDINYSARVVSIGLSSIQLYLNDSQNTQVHDSGVIDLTTATN